jgi:hypothetical protein
MVDAFATVWRRHASGAEQLRKFTDVHLALGRELIAESVIPLGFLVIAVDGELRGHESTAKH